MNLLQAARLLLIHRQEVPKVIKAGEREKKNLLRMHVNDLFCITTEESM